MVKGGKWSEAYNFSYLPSTINPETNRIAKKEENSDLDLEHSIVQREETTQRKKRV